MPGPTGPEDPAKLGRGAPFSKHLMGGLESQRRDCPQDAAHSLGGAGGLGTRRRCCCLKCKEPPQAGGPSPLRCHSWSRESWGGQGRLGDQWEGGACS